MAHTGCEPSGPGLPRAEVVRPEDDVAHVDQLSSRTFTTFLARVRGEETEAAAEEPFEGVDVLVFTEYYRVEG